MNKIYTKLYYGEILTKQDINEFIVDYITKNNLTKQVQGLLFDFKARHLEELAIEKSMGAYVNEYNLLFINLEERLVGKNG